MTIHDFTAYIEDTLIPDLREAGMDYTADDFKTAVSHIQTLVLALTGIRDGKPGLRTATEIFDAATNILNAD